ncbi:unnamed protein product [Brassica napus]|uniref:(rape) hypothetical protein n=1 Tax=Brassica napus TaxID=3708 RepID=A0A816RAJ7_BRANA|nr:unnamed protein product [Brassica napus]
MQDCSPDIQQFDNLFKSYKLSDETGCLCFGLSKLSLARQMIRQFCSADGKKRSKLYTGLLNSFSDLGSLQSDQQLLDTTFHGCEQDLLVKSVMETTPLSEVLHIKNVSLAAEVDNVMKTSSSLVVFDITVPKSVSTDNLSSMDMT